LQLSFINKLTLLSILFVVLRLINIAEPVVDRHSWNQISALNQAKNIYLRPSTFWAPEVDFYEIGSDSLVYIQEFPLYEGLVALIFNVTGVKEWPARLLSVCLAFAGFIFAVRIAREEIDQDTALLAGFLMAISSLAWYFDRTIATDSGMVSCSIISIYYGRHWVKNRRWRDYLFTFIFAMLSGLFKPFGLISLAVIGLYILQQKQYSLLKSPAVYIMGVLCFTPVLSWFYLNSGHFRNASGSAASLGLKFDILFSFGYYRTLWARFFDNVLTVSTTPFLFYFFIIKKTRKSFPAIWLAGLAIYLILISGGNEEHSYYQLIFVAPLSIAAANGLWTWKQIEAPRFFKHRAVWFWAILAVAVLRSGYYAYNHFKQDIGPYIVGTKIEEMGYPRDYKIIYFDPSITQKNQLIYYSGHQGWNLKNLDPKLIESLKEKGAKIMGVHLIDESDNFKRFMPTLKSDFEVVWSSLDCRNRYGNKCFMAIIEL